MNYYLNRDAPNLKQVADNALAHAREIYKQGKAVEIIVREAKCTKTAQQRKYAHACLGVIAKDIGYDPQRLKVDIKVQLGLIEKIYTNGQVITQITSTEQLTKEQYGAFIDAILGLAAELNIKLPEARHYGYD